MATVTTDSKNYEDIADAIREHGVEGTFKPSEMASAIEQIIGGGPADIKEAVSDWLEEHPEATTTVLDKSLTITKMVVGTLGYVTPEMFGAVGDGVVDDTQAFQQALDSKKPILATKLYKITSTLDVTYEFANISGNGTIYSYTELLFGNSENENSIKKMIINGLKFDNKCTSVGEDGLTLGCVFYDLSSCRITNCHFYRYSTIFKRIHQTTVISSNGFHTVYHKFGVSATDSMIENNYINGSQLNSSSSVMLRMLNNTSFSNNFVDYWNTVFRFQAGNRSSQIVGNTFDDCVSVFKGCVPSVTIAGNTFSNIKFVNENWGTTPSDDVKNGIWGVFVFDKDSTDNSGTKDALHIREMVFSNNVMRNCDYYIWGTDERSTYMQGNCIFSDNATTGTKVDVGFVITQAGIDKGYFDEVYFDFWDGKKYETLPRPNLTSSSASKSRRVESYPFMKCFVNDIEYININGTWKRLFIEDNNGLIMTSQNGTKFKLTVSDDGTITSTTV